MTTYQLRLDSADKVVKFIRDITPLDITADIAQHNSHIAIDAKSLIGIFSLDLRQALDLTVYDVNDKHISKVKQLIADFNCVERIHG